MFIKDDLKINQGEILKYSFWIEQSVVFGQMSEVATYLKKSYGFKLKTNYHVTLFFIGPLGKLFNNIKLQSSKSDTEIRKAIAEFIKKIKLIEIDPNKVILERPYVFSPFRRQLVVLVKPTNYLIGKRDLILKEFKIFLYNLGISDWQKFMTESPDLQYQVNWTPHITVGVEPKGEVSGDLGPYKGKEIMLDRVELKYWRK